MQVKAVRLAQRLDLRKLQQEWSFKQSYKEPLVWEYKAEQYVVFFRYGVVVFWNVEEKDYQLIIAKVKQFANDQAENPDEENVEVKIDSKSKLDGIKGGKIVLTDLSVHKVALISLVLSRSIVMDSFERELEGSIKDFDLLIKAFSDKGKINLPTRVLHKKLGFAMQIQFTAATQMAVLDRPDITWEYSNLDSFYNLLIEEYELDERYQILNGKLKILLNSTEFILNYLESKRSFYIELTIVFLILVELLIFLYDNFVKMV